MHHIFTTTSLYDYRVQNLYTAKVWPSCYFSRSLSVAYVLDIETESEKLSNPLKAITSQG